MLTRYRQPSLIVFLLVALSMISAACGSDDPPGDCLAAEDGAFVSASCDVAPGVTLEPTATPSSGGGNGGGHPGEAVFRAMACSACHSIDGTSFNGAIGPNLTTVASKGGTDYIRESIVKPDAVIAAECPTGPCSDAVMPENFGDLIDAADLDDLVDYLSSL